LNDSFVTIFRRALQAPEFAEYKDPAAVARGKKGGGWNKKDPSAEAAKEPTPEVSIAATTDGPTSPASESLSYKNRSSGLKNIINTLIVHMAISIMVTKTITITSSS
jgi:hypothetical protein